MQKSQSFKFSNQQLKKINTILPKGFKFVTRDQFNKNKHQKVTHKKKAVQQPIFYEPIPPPTLLPLPAKAKVQKQDVYQPQIIKQVQAPLLIPTQDSPAGTSLLFLERIKKHPSYANLQSYRVTSQIGEELSLKLFEGKIKEMGQAYTIEMFSGDLTAYFLEVYKFSGKTSSDYRRATQLEDYFQKLLKLQRLNVGRADLGRGQGGRKKTVPIKAYQPLSSYKMATPYQKCQLGKMIRKLSSQNLGHIINILFESTEVKQYSFDLDNLHIKKFRQLEEYVKKCIQKISDWDPKIQQDEQLLNQEQFVIENDYD